MGIVMQKLLMVKLVNLVSMGKSASSLTSCVQFPSNTFKAENALCDGQYGKPNTGTPLTERT